MKKAALYVRYSSSLQQDTSLEDQIFQCSAYCDRNGWTVTHIYKDPAKSGKTRFRPGYQSMLAAVEAREFDALVCLTPDRISRRLADAADLLDRLDLAGIELHTPSLTRVTPVTWGILATMAQEYNRQTAMRTRGGQATATKAGRVAGGIAYGYDALPADADGKRGFRSINQIQAAVVYRIFQEYAAGRSPKDIAHGLNADCIPGPRGGSWSPSCIYGHRRRDTGIINNPIYIGQIVYNRAAFKTDLNTDKTIVRLNDVSEVVTGSAPHLRIIEDDLWNAVRARQKVLYSRMTGTDGSIRPENARRPRYLLSGLLTCGVCGGGMSKISAHHYGCSNARNRGPTVCTNMLTVRRDVIEPLVLEGLQHHLMRPEAVVAFITEFEATVKAEAAQRDQGRLALQTELTKIVGTIEDAMQALIAAPTSRALADHLAKLEAQRDEIEARLTRAPSVVPVVRPDLTAVYRRKVTNLTKALGQPETATEAAELLRGLIDEVRMVPVEGKLEAHLYGSLGKLLELGNENTRSTGPGVQVTLVARPRNQSINR
jgi:DNA invertase Pin-like site-specific DNA recombinase